MKDILSKSSILFAFALAANAGSAYAQFGGISGTVGTKFACCAIHSYSTLGGGSCTTYNRTLRDRALTQVDAQIRCGTQLLQWKTHECPAPSAGCSASPFPGSGPVSSTTTCVGNITFTNVTGHVIAFNVLSNNAWIPQTISPTETKVISVIAKPNSSGSCNGAYTETIHDWSFDPGSQDSRNSIGLGSTNVFDYWKAGILGRTDLPPETPVGIRIR